MSFRVKTLLKWVLRVAARQHWPQFAAWLLARNLAPVPGIPAPAVPRYRVLVLNLNKPGFLEDIAASFGNAGDVELVSWPTYALTSFSAALLAPELSNKRYDTDDPAIEASKQCYRNFLSDVWRHFSRHSPIDAVLTANYGYYNQREFAAALRQAGTPFIALHKENVKSPGRVKYWHPIYRARGRFEGTKILVYSNTERELQITSGVANAGDVVVTGMPRLDRVHRWRKEYHDQAPATGPHQLLFFAFWKREKLTATERVSNARVRTENNEEWSRLNWNELCETTYCAIIELARSRPDIRVVMKTKPQSVRLEAILKMLGETADALPSNFVIVKGGDPIQLIAESQVIVGFNTTALLEALAAGKPVIVPDFGEARDPAMAGLIIDLGEAVHKPDSPDELKRLACRYIDTKAAPTRELSSTAAETLRQWVGNDDGRAGRRVLEAVKEEISKARNDCARTLQPATHDRTSRSGTTRAVG
jgi:glycosyltransferase involved in cell wall biosynthesis